MYAVQILYFDRLRQLASNARSDEQITSALEKAAVLVDSRWVCKSQVIFGQDLFVAACRDYLLYLLHTEHAVHRGRFMQDTKLNLEMTTKLFDAITIYDAHIKRFVLKIAKDRVFVERYPDIATRQSDEWKVREKTIKNNLAHSFVNVLMQQQQLRRTMPGAASASSSSSSASSGAGAGAGGAPTGMSSGVGGVVGGTASPAAGAAGGGASAQQVNRGARLVKGQQTPGAATQQAASASTSTSAASSAASSSSSAKHISEYANTLTLQGLTATTLMKEFEEFGVCKFSLLREHYTSSKHNTLMFNDAQTELRQQFGLMSEQERVTMLGSVLTQIADPFQNKGINGPYDASDNANTDEVSYILRDPHRDENLTNLRRTIIKYIESRIKSHARTGNIGAPLRLKRQDILSGITADYTATVRPGDFSKVMTELCISKGALWQPKSGTAHGV